MQTVCFIISFQLKSEKHIVSLHSQAKVCLCIVVKGRHGMHAKVKRISHQLKMNMRI
jgi:hypothetical protein